MNSHCARLRWAALSGAAALCVLTACSSSGGSSASPSDSGSSGGAGASAAASAAATSSGSSTADLSLVTPGTLTVLINSTYPPMEETSDSGQLQGFDPDLATALATQLGLKVKFVVRQFDALIPALQAHDGDIVESALTMTKARESQVSFVPYFQTGQAIVVPAGNPDKITAPASLCGHSVGVQVSTQNVTALEGFNSTTCASNKIQIKIYPQTSAAVLAVVNGSLDAAVDSSFTMAVAVKADPSRLEISGTFSPIVQGIATLPGNSSLHDALQQALIALRSNGTVNTLLKKWDLTSDAIPDPYVTNPPAPTK
jgi:polar amino acid transport system substrate-binding protein